MKGEENLFSLKTNISPLSEEQSFLRNRVIGELAAIKALRKRRNSHSWRTLPLFPRLNATKMSQKKKENISRVYFFETQSFLSSKISNDHHNIIIWIDLSPIPLRLFKIWVICSTNKAHQRGRGLSR